MAMKRNGKAPVSSDSDEKVVFFNDVSLGPHESQLRFRLIHFWEARNPVKKTVIGLEMLLIDEQGTVVQGFIPPGRIKKFLPDMKPNCDLRGDLYGKLFNLTSNLFVKLLYLVNGQTLTERPTLDELEIAATGTRFWFMCNRMTAL
ncbi:unnamed protein product [Brassica napus]|uniref:(rape) hypothetical protein n=1 Tax=Brassica napus TaxID=3708 RepID=A0A816XLP2_BRANA|nr:unnamed protein product [Brassica napus]